MEEVRELRKQLDAEKKVAELIVMQRDRARYDLEIFAAEYRDLRIAVGRLPKWVRKLYKLDKDK